MIRNIVSFHGEELSTPRLTSKLEDHPLWDVRDYIFNIFAATLNNGGRSSIRNLCRGDRDPFTSILNTFS